MKTIFEEANRKALIDRINALDESSKANWGKMNFFQMLKHCSLWNEWMLGINNPKYKQEFMGFIFGKMMLKKMVKDDGPIARNVPTSNFLIVKDNSGDISLQKKICIDRVSEFGNYSNPGFVHDFFGKMTQEQIGILVYKHTDHHLRQFEPI